MFGSGSIPSVGEDQLSWVPNPPLPTPSAAATPTLATLPSEPDAAKPAGFDEDTAMDTAMGGEAEGDQRKDGAGSGGNPDVDYDVAEVDDNWGQ